MYLRRTLPPQIIFVVFLFLRPGNVTGEDGDGEGIYQSSTDITRTLRSLLANFRGDPNSLEQPLKLSDAKLNFASSPILNRVCGAWDSCVLRCGDAISPPYMCSCDANCRNFNDCCADHSFYCGNTSTQTSAILDEYRRRQDEEEVTEISSDHKCFSWFGNKFYGISYDGEDIQGFRRKCVLQTPPWCYSNNTQSLAWGRQSLSLLLNFGPPGWKDELLFSSDIYDPNLCPSKWEIYDPFSQTCRPIECPDGSKAENGNCDGHSKPGAKEVVGFTTKQANITFHGNILVKDTVAQFALHSMEHDIMQTMSDKIRIDKDRLTLLEIEKTTNETNPYLQSTTPPPSDGAWDAKNDSYKDFHSWILTEQGFPVTVKFSISRKEPNKTNELTIEQVLSVLGEAVALRAVLQTSLLVPMKIYSVERNLVWEEIEFFDKWCNGGDLASYWNDDFVFGWDFQDPDNTLITIKKTNTTYSKGHYIANLLFQAFDINAEISNLSGIVIVCENRPTIADDNCTRLVLFEEEYSIAENGSLLLETDVHCADQDMYDRTEYEFGSYNNTAKICMQCPDDKRMLPDEDTLWDIICSYLTLIPLICSLGGLLLTIFTYALFSELRTLPGWCLIHLCIGQFGFFTLFSFCGEKFIVENPGFCTSLAVGIHLFALLFFAWSSVISYDLWVTFTKFQPVTRSKEKYLWKYSAFAYGLPAAFVFSCVMVEFHSSLRIEYGTELVCWIGNPMASMYIFAIPIATSLLCNLVFFTLTVCGIRKVARMGAATNLGQQNRARFTLYLRMSSVQCFAWLFGFLYVFSGFDATVMKIFEFLFIFLSSCQGLYLFGAFVINRRVIRLYKELVVHRRFPGRNSSGKSFGFSVRSTIIKPDESKGSTKRTDDNNNGGHMKHNENGAHREKYEQNGPNLPGPDLEVPPTLIRRQNSISGKNNIAERTVSNETCISYVD